MRDSHYTITAGIGKDIEHYMITNTIEEAEDCFVDAKERLLDVNNWNRYNPVPGISFRLTDGHGRDVHRRAHKGDHIKIDVPGGDGIHCCAVIEAIEYDDYPDLGMEAFTLRLHPCSHAGTEDNDHGLPEGAMIIERRGKQVYTAFQARKAPDQPAVNEDFCGLYEAQWNSIANRFAA